MTLYEIKFYADKNGNKPVLNYLKELVAKGDKDSRIKANKIQDYINLLKEFGTSLGEPYVKHLDGKISELRPLKDRILFAAWTDNKFILLSHFVKKTRKKPPREIEKAKKDLRRVWSVRKMDKDYQKAIEQAKQNLADLMERSDDAIGDDWEEVRKELFTAEEIAESDSRVAVIRELIKARQEREINQKQFEEFIGALDSELPCVVGQAVSGCVDVKIGRNKCRADYLQRKCLK